MGFFDSTSLSAVREMGDVYQDKAARLSEEARTLFRQGNAKSAEEKVRELVDLQSRVVGERHPDFANGLTMLAELLIAQQELSDAEVLIQRAIEIRKKGLGEHHPDYAASLDLMARLMLAWEDLEGAEPLLRKALEIRKTALGEHHPDYAASLSTLAELLAKRSEFEEAEPLLREAMDIQTRVHGEDHVDVSDTGLHLAEILTQLGRFDEAEPLTRRTLAFRKNFLGETHPDHLAALTSLATLLQLKGDLDESESLWRLLLEMRRQALGEKHNECAVALTQLGQLRLRRGDPKTAEHYYRQALEIQKNSLGERHPEYATSLTTLGLILQRLGDLSAAEPMLRQALAIRKEILGTQNPEYAASLVNLATLVQRRGDTAWAKMLLRESVDVRRAIYGEHHPEYALSLAALGELMIQCGDPPARTELLLRQVLEIRAETLGEDHPSYAASLTSLAGLMRKQENYDAAESFLRQAMEIRERCLGTKNPDFLTTLGNLAWVLQHKGDREGAERLLVRSLEIRKNALGEAHPDYLQNLERLRALQAAPPVTRIMASPSASREELPHDEHGPALRDDKVASNTTLSIEPPGEPVNGPTALGLKPVVAETVDSVDEAWDSTTDPSNTYAEAMSQIYDEIEGDPEGSDTEAAVQNEEPPEFSVGPTSAASPAVETGAPSAHQAVECDATKQREPESLTSERLVGLQDFHRFHSTFIERGEATNWDEPGPPLHSHEPAHLPLEFEWDGPDTTDAAASAMLEVAVTDQAPVGLIEESPLFAEEPRGHRSVGNGCPEPGAAQRVPNHLFVEPLVDAEPEHRPMPEPAAVAPIPVEPFAAGLPPARSLSMSLSSSHLSQEVAEMSDQFSELGERLLTAARQLQAPGTPPPDELIEAVGLCRREFVSLRDRARSLAESLLVSCSPAEQLGSLNEVTSLLDHAAEAEIHQSKSEESRRRALSVLDRVASLHHAGGDFAPLREAQEKAGALHALVAGSPWHHLPEEVANLAEGEHPFANLVSMICDQDELADDHWATLLETVTQTFGKELAAAAARSRITLPAQATN